MQKERKVPIKATTGGKEYPLVLVRWVDSYFDGAGWSFISQEPTQKKVCVSVGFLHEDTANIRLYPHIHASGTNDFQGSGIITIPKCSVMETIRLTGDKNYAQE